MGNPPSPHRDKSIRRVSQLYDDLGVSIKEGFLHWKISDPVEDFRTMLFNL